jgi:hypothetical protein
MIYEMKNVIMDGESSLEDGKPAEELWYLHRTVVMNEGCLRRLPRSTPRSHDGS